MVNEGTQDIKKTTGDLALLLYLVLILLVTYLLLSRSVGGYYQVHVLSNMYLPNLGIDSELASVTSRSFIAYVALMRVVSLVCGTGALATTHIMAFFSVLYVFLSYVLLLRVLPGDQKVKRIVV